MKIVIKAQDMSGETDSTVRPVGLIVANWTPPPSPTGEVLKGRYVSLEPLDAEIHSQALFAFYKGHDWVWDYMPYGPFKTVTDLHTWVDETVADPAHLFYAVRDMKTGDVTGFASYLRINRESGSTKGRA